MKKYHHIPTGKIACFPTDDKGRPKSTGWEEEDKIDIPLFLVQGKDWEEVKDKPEWTILSFKSIQSTTITLGSSGGYEWEGQSDCYYLKDILELPKVWFIHSVRRESDGEVFTVGDDFPLLKGGTSKIKKFYVDDEGASLQTEGGNVILIDSWRKVQHKEWEITALRQIGDGTASEIVAVKNGMLSTRQFHSPLSIEPALKNWVVEHKTWEIYSVKRLSDGVEFKIGDKVRDDASNSTDRKKVRTIQKISLQENGLLVLWVGDTYAVFIKDAIKVKLEKLFTTEDGVDKYEGDEVWEVRTDHGFTLAKDKIYRYQETGSQFTAYPHWKFFANSEAAEEYILMNKPCLSLADLESLSESKEGCFTEVLIKYAKELVKSKLK